MKASDLAAALKTIQDIQMQLLDGMDTLEGDRAEQDTAFIEALRVAADADEMIDHMTELLNDRLEEGKSN